jgi:glutathione S-transferase
VAARSAVAIRSSSRHRHRRIGRFSPYETRPMIRLYFAPRTRSVRIAWLLEELALPYELERVQFQPTMRTFFAQATPLKKLPTIDDGGIVMSESGAIVEYILERYGRGRLAPAVDDPLRAQYLQWLHFAESTAFPPLGIVVWLTLYRTDADQHPDLVADARSRVKQTFDYVEAALGERSYLVGNAFTAADIMMGFTLAAARLLGLLDSEHPRLLAYLQRLEARPAYLRARAID